MYCVEREGMLEPGTVDGEEWMACFRRQYVMIYFLY